MAPFCTAAYPSLHSTPRCPTWPTPLQRREFPPPSSMGRKRSPPARPLPPTSTRRTAPTPILLPRQCIGMTQLLTTCLLIQVHRRRLRQRVSDDQRLR